VNNSRAGLTFISFGQLSVSKKSKFNAVRWIEKILASYEHGDSLHTFASKRIFNFNSTLKIVIVHAREFGLTKSVNALSENCVADILQAALEEVADPKGSPDVRQHFTKIKSNIFKPHCKANLASYHLENINDQSSTNT